MNPIEPVVTEFELESGHTRKALERVPEDRFDWQPHQKSWTFAKLASHLAEIPIWAATIVDTEELDVAQGDYKPFLASSRAELLQTFDRNVAAAAEKMRQAEAGIWGKPWCLRAGDKVIWKLPRIAVAKTLLINHAIQHRGQLTVYLRLNDAPVPSIYGPSADEPG